MNCLVPSQHFYYYTPLVFVFFLQIHIHRDMLADAHQVQQQIYFYNTNNINNSRINYEFESWLSLINV